MKTIVKVLISLILCSISASSMAQTMVYASAPDAAEIEMLQSRAKEKVALMNSYISYMADKRNNYNTRQYYSEKALALFIGKGYSYSLDGIKHEGVLMQTTSTNTKKTSTSLMRRYFESLINLHYTDVKITSTSVVDMKVSDLKKIGPNLYVCTCQYVQYFYGYRDGSLVYKDRTTKRIECIIEAEETEDGIEYVVQLGDVEALHTERI